MTDTTGRSRAKICLTATTLERILDLPLDVGIVAIEVNNDPISISVIVEGPRLSKIGPDQVCPRIYPEATTDPHRLRFNWSPAEDGAQ